MTDISIVIVTHNRAEELGQTLRAIGGVSLPAERSVELLVVDNGSADETRSVVEGADLHGMTVRYLYEGRQGKSWGLNLAIRELRGTVVVFTDDDVRPRRDWLTELASPIFEGGADAVQGTILLAEDRQRPWMGPRVRASLAHHVARRDERQKLIGANFAVRRSVLESVGGFDTRIGPPITGGGEDTLFSEQVEERGFRIVAAPDAIVDHYPRLDRLRRRCILRSAWLGGCSDAFLAHHYYQQQFDRVNRRLVRSVARLWKHRFMRCPELRGGRVPDWEFSDVKNMGRWWAYRRELRHGGAGRSPGTESGHPRRHASAPMNQ